jgi:hypothetical protein
MRILLLAAALSFLCTAAALAAPRERIDPKSVRDKISLTLGTKGTIQFKQQGDMLTDPKLGDADDRGKPGMGVELKKEDKLFILVVQNRFPKGLRYRAAARLKGAEDFVETSVVRVGARLSSFESWDDPIEEIILFDFKLTDEKP